MNNNLKLYTGLFVAQLAVSWSAIFIRWMDDTPALVIAVYRMIWAVGIFAIWQWRKAEPGRSLRLLNGRERLWVVVAGFFLALHFFFWITSVQYTTVAHAATIYATQPVFALILGPFLLKESGDRRAIIAVALAMLGVVIISGMDMQIESSRQLFGDALALGSALSITLYLFVARHLRSKADLLPYLIGVYCAAGVFLLLACLLLGLPLSGYSWKIHLLFLLMALIPTGIGHSLMNWAARKIEAWKVNMSNLGEPLFASLLAYWFFAELPGEWFYAGAGLIVVGIAMALTKRSVKNEK